MEYNLNQVFKKKLTDFFGQYIEEKEDFISVNGTIPIVIIQDIVKLLFDKYVFISIRDIRKTALRECGVFLPDYLFETYLEDCEEKSE